MQCTLVCNENENKNEHIKVYMHAHTNTHRYPFVRTDTCAHRSGKFSIVGGALDTEPRMRMREKIKINGYPAESDIYGEGEHQAYVIRFQ